MNVSPGYEVMHNGTDIPLLFQMVSSADHVLPMPALAPMVTISKNGAPFVPAAGAVSEVGNGWYRVVGGNDLNTLGSLVLYATALLCDSTSVIFQVVANNPNSNWVADLWRPVYGIPR